MQVKRTVFRFCIFCTSIVIVSSLLCGCTLGPITGLFNDGYSAESDDPIVGTWSYSHAYDKSLMMTTQRSESYFLTMTFYADGTAVLLRDHGVSYLEPSEIKGDWELIEKLDGGCVYNVNWYTESTSASFELIYLVADDKTEDAVCAWNVQMPADENVYLYYSRN